MNVLRGELIKGTYYPNVSKQVATFIARTTYATSDFALSVDEKHKLCSKFSNPDLCKTTNDVFFMQPWIEHDWNKHEDYLKPKIAEMRNNKRNLCLVAELKSKFVSSSQALIHGDLHTG